MGSISVKERYKNEIDQIWNDEYFKSINALNNGYAIHDIIKQNALLFIGINPSFQEGSECISHFINIDEDKKLYPYFTKFKYISNQIGLEWTHYDLLFFRKTKQNYIHSLLKNEVGIKFLYQQLEISRKVIIDSSPRIIVISNALARHFTGFDKSDDRKSGVWMDFNFKFDEDIGTFRITNTELNGVPVFFTSMLTGQRALDKGSFERLVWHIKFVLNFTGELK